MSEKLADENFGNESTLITICFVHQSFESLLMFSRAALRGFGSLAIVWEFTRSNFRKCLSELESLQLFTVLVVAVHDVYNRTSVNSKLLAINHSKTAFSCLNTPLRAQSFPINR